MKNVIIVNPEDFSNLGIEGQSLAMREYFEAAAMQFIDFSKNDMEEAEAEIKASLKVSIVRMNDEYFVFGLTAIINNMSVYNETLFPNKNVFNLGDEAVSGIKVTPEIILRYASSEAVKKINGFEEAILKEGWRTNPDIIVQNEVSHPQIVLRGIREIVDDEAKTEQFGTYSYYYCDAQTIVSQQLINISYTRADLKEQFGFDFSGSEGRGAYFTCFGVPFHAYNSRMGNDTFCEFMCLLKSERDYDQLLWMIKSPLPSEVSVISLDEAQSYSQIPAIRDRQEMDDYHTALAISLPTYIEASLRYQKSLAPMNRIKSDKGIVASDEEIDHALNKLPSNIKKVRCPAKMFHHENTVKESVKDHTAVPNSNMTSNFK